MLLPVEETPGVRLSSVYTLRPTIGSVVISVFSTVRPICALSVLTSGAVAVTSTSSVMVPTSSAASTRAFTLTSSAMPFCTNFLKPVAVTSTV